MVREQCACQSCHQGQKNLNNVNLSAQILEACSTRDPKLHALSVMLACPFVTCMLLDDLDDAI